MDNWVHPQKRHVGWREDSPPTILGQEQKVWSCKSPALAQHELLLPAPLRDFLSSCFPYSHLTGSAEDQAWDFQTPCSASPLIRDFQCCTQAPSAWDAVSADQSVKRSSPEVGHGCVLESMHVSTPLPQSCRGAGHQQQELAAYSLQTGSGLPPKVSQPRWSLACEAKPPTQVAAHWTGHGRASGARRVPLPGSRWFCCSLFVSLPN